MAITKLMHMKEAPGFAPKHLINAINYILDERHLGKKTGYGEYVGGNVGTSAQEVIDAFLDTKDFYRKTDGRQGYHFVISFQEGECDIDTCYKLAGEFCQKYFGDDYEYVYAVHNDKGHAHAHIIFNSVSRSTGLKYRYEKGDWEKYIQPITDELCINNGIMPLVYQEATERKTYAQWLYEKEHKNINWSHIIMADIDYAIDNAAGSMENFLGNMKELGYYVRPVTVKGELELSFRLYERDGEVVHHDEINGSARNEVKVHKRRTSKLPNGYRYNDILEKLKEEKLENPYYKELGNILESKAALALSNAAVLRNTESYRRMYQAVSYYKLPNPFAVPSSQVRSDMRRINKLIEECNYIKKHLIKGGGSLQDKAAEVEEKLHALYIHRKNLYRIREEYRHTKYFEKTIRYQQIDEILSQSVEWGGKEEALEDERIEIEKEVPSAVLINEEALNKCKYDIAALVKEKRMLTDILIKEKGKESHVNVNMRVETSKKLKL